MRKARRFISREKQVFFVGFSLAFAAFPRISKNRLNTSLLLSNLMEEISRNPEALSANT